jgi:hypothetical protein
MDTTRLGHVAADLMDHIAEEYGATDGVTLGIVAVIAEVDLPDSDGEPGWTTVQYRCSDARRWIQAGLFDAARRGVESSSEEVD